jgi:hypothetical protein
VTRSDVRATLGNKLDPGFWPARGRRNNAEDTPPHFGTNRWRPLRQPSQGLWPYWRPGALREDSEHNINVTFEVEAANRFSWKDQWVLGLVGGSIVIIISFRSVAGIEAHFRMGFDHILSLSK